MKLPDYLAPIPRDENPPLEDSYDHDLEKVGDSRDLYFDDCDHEQWRCKKCSGTAWFEVIS